MPSIPATMSVPLEADTTGTIRIVGSRVTLDTIVTAFQCGSTSETIAQKFPTIPLADVYQVIAFYLQHQPEIDGYMANRRQEARCLRQTIEQGGDMRGIRARIQSRVSAHQPT
jgi:uncharacterized protein (DUF433 family)